MEQILITPKSKSAFVFLKKLFSDLDSIEQVEIIEDGEVVDDVFLRKIIKNSKSGFTTEERLMKTLKKMRSAK